MDGCYLTVWSSAGESDKQLGEQTVDAEISQSASSVHIPLSVFNLSRISVFSVKSDFKAVSS